jgi:hypothetical protein
MQDIKNVSPPNLPLAPVEYNRQYQEQLNNVLRLYFNLIAAPQNFAVLGLNFDIARMPTQADLSTLRSGDVYRDTSAGNVLKVKV